MHILPAIDLKQDDQGRTRCVRLLQGKADTATTFSDDPPGVARRWAECGARWLHVVDLDGAFSGKPVNTGAIRAIRTAVDLDIEVGGGIRDDESAAVLLDEVGVTRVVVGTRGLLEPDWLAALCERYPGRIVAGLDACDGTVAVEGWTRDAGVDVLEAAERLAECRPAAIVFTDIATDGMLSGPNIEATRRLAEHVEVPVIASGGISTLEDIRRVARLPVEGVIIGKALYSGAVDLREALSFAAEA